VIAEELLIRWAPIPGTPQETFFDDDTPNAKLLFAGGYGAGKTMTMVAKALKLSAINAPLPGLITVPNFDHVLDTFLPTLEECDPDTGAPWFLRPDQFHYRESHHLLEWDGGGPIHFYSGEAPRAIKGPNMAWGGVDEPGIQPYEAWRNTVNRVRNPRAVLRQVFGAGTPEGLGWLMDKFGEELSALYRVYTMDTRQNSELLRHFPEYVAQVKENATDAEIASYLGGKFANLTGALAYPTFDRGLHWIAGVPEADAGLPLRVTFDFNVDPMACVVGQQIMGASGPEAIVTDVFTLYASTVMQVCAAIVERYPRWPAGLVIYGDATGSRRSHQSLRSNYEVIRELLAGVGPVTLRVPKDNPPVSRRLNSVNVFLQNAAGAVRLRIKKTEPAAQCRTKALVRSLEQTVKKPGESDIWKKPGETVTHAADALGYWIAAEFPAERPLVTGGGMTVDWLN
jgi:hypothetical protein